MRFKEVLIAAAIMVLTIFVAFYGINTFFPSANYDDYCRSNAKICPAVCTPVYDIAESGCVFNECGSGCGPDGIYSFSDLNSCNEGIKLSDQKKCELQNGSWIRQDIQCIKAPCPQGYCDTYSLCNQDFNDAQKERSKWVFFIALPLGIIIILIGAFAFGLEAVGVGLVGGGIGTLIYGSGAFWPYTQNWIRFLLSLLGLVILIWAVYFFNKKLGKKGKK
ncbi:MAG: hypothetical protein AABW50_05035 [Nanoarchaeota archaeon]